jgi:hypothetical protein
MKQLKLVTMLTLTTLLFVGGPSLTYAKTKAHSSRQMIKEKTGRCYFNETVTKTNLGWLSQAEMTEIKKKGIKPYAGRTKKVSLRQVYVPRDWCARKNS